MSDPHVELVQSICRLIDAHSDEPLTLADLGDQDRDHGDIRTAIAALRIAQGDPSAATAALAPVLDGSAPVTSQPLYHIQSFLLEAIARDALGDPGAAEHALERALDLAEPDGVLVPFLLHPAPGLLERHARHRTAHASLIAEIAPSAKSWPPDSLPAEADHSARTRSPSTGTPGAATRRKYKPDI